MAIKNNKYIKLSFQKQKRHETSPDVQITDLLSK